MHKESMDLINKLIDERSKKSDELMIELIIFGAEYGVRTAKIEYEEFINDLWDEVQFNDYTAAVQKHIAENPESFEEEILLEEDDEPVAPKVSMGYIGLADEGALKALDLATHVREGLGLRYEDNEEALLDLTFEDAIRFNISFMQGWLQGNDLKEKWDVREINVEVEIFIKEFIVAQIEKHMEILDDSTDPMAFRNWPIIKGEY